MMLENPMGLSGISVHPEYVRSYKDWVKETSTRQKENLPTRTFQVYLHDPNDDGRYDDDLTMTNWYAEKSRPGMDPEYSTMASELALMRNGRASYWATRMTQPQFIRTTAEDYFPDWMNVFTKENGERTRSYDIVKGNDFDDVLWRGLTGGVLSLGNLAVGGAVGGLGIFLLLKLANKNFDDVVELPFVAVGGMIEGVGTLLGTVAKQFTRRGDFTSAFNES